MEIAIGMVGAAITVLGVVFAYSWRANGKMEKAILRKVSGRGLNILPTS